MKHTISHSPVFCYNFLMKSVLNLWKFNWKLRNCEPIILTSFWIYFSYQIIHHSTLGHSTQLLKTLRSWCCPVWWNTGIIIVNVLAQHCALSTLSRVLTALASKVLPELHWMLLMPHSIDESSMKNVRIIVFQIPCLTQKILFVQLMPGLYNVKSKEYSNVK